MVFVFLCLGLKPTVLGLIAGIFMPPSYKQNWQMLYLYILHVVSVINWSMFFMNLGFGKESQDAHIDYYKTVKII